MCYSEEQSKTTFILNIITCLVLYHYPSKTNTNKILALFFAFVGFMQLFDWILWRHQDTSNPKSAKINEITTKIALFFNHLQPIILGFLIYYYTGTITQLSKKLLIGYTVVILIYTLSILDEIKYTQKEILETNKKETLFWEWNSKKYFVLVYIIFLITLSVVLYENFNYPINVILTFLTNISFFLSLSYFKTQSVGRYWCKIAAFVPVVFLFINEN